MKKYLPVIILVALVAISTGAYLWLDGMVESLESEALDNPQQDQQYQAFHQLRFMAMLSVFMFTAVTLIFVFRKKNSN